MANGVIIGPFAANVQMVSPTDEGNLGLLKWVEWEELGGLLGPARRLSQQIFIWHASRTSVRYYGPIGCQVRQLDSSIPRYLTAMVSDQTPIGPLQLSIYSIKVDGQFSFEDFTTMI